MRSACLVAVLLVGCEGGPTLDGGVGDGGARDAGALDAGLSDGGGFDGGHVDAGVQDAGVLDGGALDAGELDAGAFDGGLCAPCIASSDCAPGAFCRGGVAPRCGSDCASLSCPGGLTCEYVHAGRGPVLGNSCLATDAFCGGARAIHWPCVDTFQSYARDFFANTCIGTCHRHDQAFTLVDSVRPAADDVRLDIERGSMPPDVTLSAAERRRILTWLACGAP